MSRILKGETPKTKFLDEIDAIKVSLISWPDIESSKRLIINVASGYNDPKVYDKLNNKEREEAINEIIREGSLPKCLEMLGKFVVLIENIPLTCTHMWCRERFFTILQESTAVVDVRHKSFIMPRSFSRNEEYYEKIKFWYLEGKNLFVEGVEKHNISVQDGRLLLPKNNTNHIFLGFDALAFKNAYFRRSCTQEEPVVSTTVFEIIKNLILEKFPYLDGLFVSSCSIGACLHSKTGKHANVVFARNDIHKKFLPKDYDLSKEETLHDKTRDEINTGPEIKSEYYIGYEKI